MIRRIFPVGSKQFNSLEKLFKSLNKDVIERIEIFFPMWCMFAFQHYLVKSFDIKIFRVLNIDLNNNYLFSLIREDLIGVISIVFHSILLLWLMRKYDFFGPFRLVKTDFQTNFLLFLVTFSFIDVIFFGKMMLGLFLMLTVLYIVYRSNSLMSKTICFSLTVFTMIFSINMNEPVMATSAVIYLPILLISFFLRTKEMTSFCQKYLLLILFIFISTKELWFGFIGLGYFLFFNLYYFSVYQTKYNWLKLDIA